MLAASPLCAPLTEKCISEQNIPGSCTSSAGILVGEMDYTKVTQETFDRISDSSMEKENKWGLSMMWTLKKKKKMAIRTSVLAWEISWTEEPGRLQSMGLQRVGHDWGTKHHQIVVSTVKRMKQGRKEGEDGESGEAALWMEPSGWHQSRPEQTVPVDVPSPTACAFEV